VTFPPGHSEPGALAKGEESPPDGALSRSFVAACVCMLPRPSTDFGGFHPLSLSTVSRNRLRPNAPSVYIPYTRCVCPGGKACIIVVHLERVVAG